MKSPALKYAVMVQRLDGSAFDKLAVCADPGPANHVAIFYVTTMRRPSVQVWTLKAQRLDKCVEEFPQ